MTKTSASIRDDAAAIAATSVAILIPAFGPGPILIDIVRSLAGSGFTAIVVVDDGSARTVRGFLSNSRISKGARVIHHAVNPGKGAALKTGMNCLLVDYPGLTGIVTVDADGQHDPADVVRVARLFAERPGALVLGVREFVGHVPLRSRLGNSITQTAMRVVAGQSLSDTQTGLRAIFRALVERMLSVPASGYEFELEMLIAAKQLGFVVEQPISAPFTKRGIRHRNSNPCAIR